MEPRDRADDEIHDLLRQPMGRVAGGIASGWLQLYRAQALQAASLGTTLQERQAGVSAARAELLRRLRELLPELIRLETRYDREVSEAQSRAERVYRERFDEEVSRTLEDPDFDRPTAERIATAELHTFRKELERELEELVGHHRRRLLAAVRLLIEEDA
jgi:hypothetical protein